MTTLAVGSERVSRIVGYALKKGEFRENTPNLPQRIAVLGQANSANQAGLSLDPKEITSSQEAGELYGFGSPIHQMARILKPINSSGVGGIPIIVYPQAEGAATESILTMTVTAAANATKNAVHKLFISGRSGIDGESYDINIVKGDTPALITAKIVDAVSNVLGSPVTAIDAAPDVTFTSKWKGLTSAEINIVVDTDGNDAGVSYAVVATQVGTVTPTVTSSLEKFGNEWNTIVLNPYGTETFDEIETFNGVPGDNPTGRYQAITFKPFLSFWGSVESDKDTLAAITNAAERLDQVTHVLCPAPNSKACTWEAIANACVLASRVYQDTPHLDISGASYPDMPVPSDKDIGDMAVYDNRDFLVKKGCSTVDLVNNAYQVQDFVSTYHPAGENPPQFRFARNLMIDFNVRFGYYLLEKINVVDHSIAESDQPIRVGKVVKPKQWIAVLNTYSEDLGQRNLIVDVQFMQDSITVETNDINPDRFDTFFRYKRSPFVRIVSTTGEAGFAFNIN